MPDDDSKNLVLGWEDRSQERMRTIFAKIARRYELFNHLSSFGLDRLWLKSFVDSCPVGPDSRVLDVAGGTGEVAFRLCRRKRCESVVLSDLTPEMLNVASEKIERGFAEGASVELVVADAQDLSFADSAFDAVTMAYGIRNVPDREKALKEAHRVLVPGGHACFLEFSTPDIRILRPFHRAYLNWVIPLWGRICTGGRDEFDYLAESIQAFPNKVEFARMLYEAGFSNVEWKPLSLGIVAVHIARK